ncbi:MAG: anhydro-N-acetylmuramic acid kinase, partial [Pseudomonadota bacterium]
MLKPGRVWALGAMSGTSLDGVDAALIDTDGEQVFGFGAHGYRGYRHAERTCLREALGRWHEDDTNAALAVVQSAHQEVLGGFEEADLIGFHGQTLVHDPGGRGTHQLGDGAALAEALGLPVVWDFRSADMELGGEG